MFKDMTMGHQHSNRDILSVEVNEEDPEDMDIESMLSKSSKGYNKEGLSVPMTTSYTSPW